MKEAIICMWLILQLCATEGVPPPGLTSLKKCNDFYNLGVPVKNFTPLTKEELDRINKNELFYQPVDGYAGGVKALPTQLPFMAALGYDNDGQKEFLCGGTLISEEFVLTAAHCIHSRAGGRIKYIRLGDLNLKNSSDDANAQEFQLKEVYVHPEYKSPIKYHDIALVKLDRPAVLTEHVSPACLEPKRVDIKYMIFDAAGWGQLGYGEEASNHLQVGTLRHYQGAECQQTFGKDHTIPEGVKPEFQICAGAYAHLADTCEGDSGGPLAYKISPENSKVVHAIAGITSFGKACAIAKIPAIYTRVSYYTNWIEKIVWPNEFTVFNRDRIYFPES